MRIRKPVHELPFASKRGREYGDVWDAVLAAKGSWVPIECNDVRQARLIAGGVRHTAQVHGRRVLTTTDKRSSPVVLYVRLGEMEAGP